MLAAASLITLAGCSSMPERIKARPVAAGSPLSLGPEEVLLFGQVGTLVNGEVNAPNWNLFGTGAFLQLRKLPALDVSDKSLSESAFIGFETDKNGSYRMVVPAGRYVLTRAHLFSECTLNLKMAVNASVPGRAYYLGELIVDLEASSGLIASAKTCSRLNYLEVIDDFEGARTALLVEMPGMVLASTGKQLMRRVPGSFPSSERVTYGGAYVNPGSIHFGK
ncbi:MAG: hypothetical protein FIA96_17630 [Betaproteobacteria bacterium]|nr:hypothetical protein [Betaproteobacteria bacterium]